MSINSRAEHNGFAVRGCGVLSLAGLLLGATVAPVGSLHAAAYFVDQQNSAASDSNPGTDVRPWRSLYALNGRALAPGDVVTVRDGTYSMPNGGNWDVPSANIGASGTQASPIIIKAENPLGAILDGGGNAANAPLGSNNRDWITIDGFEIRNVGPKGIAIFDATGVVVQNCYIHHVVWNTVTGDNTDGIRIERSHQITIRNNEVTDINNGVSGAWNAAGVKLYDTSNVVVEHNYFHDWSGAGMYDKRGGVNNTYRYNLIANVYDGFALNTIPGYPAGNLQFHNNILRNVHNLIQTVDGMEGAVAVFSNTFAGYKELGIRVRGGVSSTKYSVYNNIFVRSSSPTPMGELVVVNTSWLGRSNYNVYPTTALFVTNQYLGNQTSYSSLGAWQSAFPSFDGQSRSANPDFVDAAGGNYHLTASSPLKGTARVGGVSSGAAIDPGAYSTGGESIGKTTSGVTAPPKPLPPDDVSVQ